MNTSYKRILLKLSGEVLGSKNSTPYDWHIMSQITADIKEVIDKGIQVAIVIGGGNIFRGFSGTGLGVDRVTGDSAGMLATAINSLMIAEALKSKGCNAEVFSALSLSTIAEQFTARKAIESLDKGNVVLIACGTGNPFFTTDTAAALRCCELKCDVLLKATKVDGIYDSDPVKNPNARKIPALTHAEALQKNLQVMDTAAFSLCMENGIPIIVFKLMEPHNLLKCVQGQSVGSTVHKEA